MCTFTCLARMVFMQRQRIEDLLRGARVVVRSSKIKITRFHLADYVKKFHQKRAARAQRLFFLIQPIKSLIGGGVVVISYELPNLSFTAST